MHQYHSNESQYLDWENRNCCQCELGQKVIANQGYKWGLCEVFDKITESAIDPDVWDDELLKRCGHPGDFTLFSWVCAERKLAEVKP